LGSPRATRTAAAAAGAVALAGAGVAARALWFEPRRTVVRTLDLALPHWPASYAGFRIALISDLHAGGPHVDVDRVARVASLAQSLEPDLVALLGDYVDPELPLGERVAPEDVAAALGGIRARCGTVAVLGNHDWADDGPRVAAALRDAGVRVLENEAARLVRVPEELWVAGLADATTRQPSVDRALAAVPAGAAVLLLSHDPDVFPRVPARVALTLSGHTHGGQVDVPAVPRSWIPSRFGERYAGGHVVERGRHLVISRGVGSSRLPIRLGVPPEIWLLRLSSSR
jgi:predicted MPP superfamily phosphohydrolase